MKEESLIGESSTEESDRQYRVIDQMTTMHAWLRDRYSRRALLLNTTQIGLSLFLCVSAFVVDEVFVSLGLEAARARLVIGLAAACVLIVAITEFRVDWRGKAFGHANAVRELSELKATYRRAWQRRDSGVPGDAETLTEEYERVMALAPSVPERQFIGLKGRHEFKRMLSEEVSRNPAVPVWMTWVRLRCGGRRVQDRRQVGERKVGND